MLLRRSCWILLPALLLAPATASRAENGLTRWFTSDYDYEPGSRKQYHSGREWPLAPRCDGPCEPYVQQYHTAHYWPDPYRWEDRAMVRGHFAAQRNLGWIAATTLYEQHFDPLSNELNIAGRQHLRWILLHAPPSRRMTWVQSGESVEVSDTRLASVQKEASKITGNNVPLVMLRTTLPIGTSAEEMDLVRRSYLENIPKPRIPVSTSGGSNATGGAQSSNSSQTTQGQ